MLLERTSDLYLVADGMGGHGHGDVASRLAATSVRDAIDRGAATNAEPSGTEPEARRLEGALRSANERLREAVDREPSFQGMGTTMVAFRRHGRYATIAHVGDSRVYRLRGADLQILTRDHSWVAEQVYAGRMSEEQARDHPMKSVVTRALGSQPEVAIDLLELELAAGDLYLLCTDGLTSQVSEDDVRARLLGESDLEATCRTLVDAANGVGGTDNVTVLLIRVEEPDGSGEPVEDPR